MPFLMHSIVEEPFPRRETILLHFNKVDSQIVRDWRESNNIKDMFDEKN